MGLRAFLRFVALGALATGCAALAGLEDPTPTSTDDPQEVVGAPRGARDDAAIEGDASSGQDATAEDPSTKCTASVTAIEPQAVHAARWAGSAPPVIDGNFDEWACIPRVELGPGDFTSSSFPVGTAKASVAIRWTPSALYLYAVVTTLAPGYDEPLLIHNDHISFFIGPPGLPPGEAYRPGDHRLAFDYQGRTLHHRNVSAEPWPLAVTFASKAQTGTTIVAEHEIKIEPALLDLAQFEQGKSYLFGIQLTDHVNDLAQYRIWYRGPACGCSMVGNSQCCYSGGRNHPGCDMRCNGVLRLD